MPHPIQESVGFRLANILKLKRRFVDTELKSLGLTRTQWQVLVWLRILGPCSQKELLQQLDIDGAHLARILEEFENNEFIIRAPLKEDRRSLMVRLSAQCKRKLIPKIEAALKKENSRLLQGFTADENQALKAFLERLENNINPLSKINNKYAERINYD